MPLFPWQRPGFTLKYEPSGSLDINDDEAVNRDLNLRSNPIMGIALTYKTSDRRLDPPSPESSLPPLTTSLQKRFIGLPFAVTRARVLASLQSCMFYISNSLRFLWDRASTSISPTPPPDYTTVDRDGVASTPPKAMGYSQ